MGSLSCELIWILKLFYDMCLKNIVLENIFCENDYAIKLAMNPTFHDNTKHFEIDVHFISENITKGDVKLVKISCSNQVVDIFTKSLVSLQHEILSEKLCLFDLFS